MEVYPGDIVVVRAFPNKQFERRVLDINPPFIILTTDDELAKAKAELRDPLSIGFRMADIIKILDREDVMPI